MMLQHLDKHNLHHAYLIEGNRDEIVPELFNFFEEITIKTTGNPDFCHIAIDNFKIDEAFNLRDMSSNKSFSSAKQIFVICTNSISIDAQNVLLKMFEEPTDNTHFIMIVPDAKSLLKTLLSRFYFISAGQKPDEINAAQNFVKMPLFSRMNFIKELLMEPDDKNEEGNEIVMLDSNRSKALKFLSTLEFVLHKKATLIKQSDVAYFQHLFKVREFLRMPGSSTKSLMESIALIVPNF